MGCLVWILLTFTLLAPAQVWAEPPGNAPQPSDAEQSAAPDAPEQTLRAALEAYERGDLELANTLLQRVHIERPSARTLRGLGIVAFQQERYADALVLLEQSLVHPDKPLDDALRANVQQLIALSRTHLGELTLHVTPADAQLLVDGRTMVYASGTPLTVVVGAHELSLRREGYEPKNMSIAIAAASELSLDVTLTKSEPLPVATTPPIAAPPQSDVRNVGPSSEPPGAANSKRARLMLWSGYAASALAALAFGGAIAAAAVADHRVEQVESACEKLPGGQCSPADVARREDEKNLPRLERIATSALIVGGAAAVTATTLLVLAYKRPTRDAMALSLSVHVRF